MQHKENIDDLSVRAEWDIALEHERLAREAALISQEHRLIPAIRNIAELLLRRNNIERKELLPNAISAFAWCLLPSPGTTTVGLVAIVTLFVTWQQSVLLALQNEKIEVQNMLSEAQRRSGLMFELSAIFERIDSEKKHSRAKNRLCSDNIHELCYSSTRFAQRKMFVPSRATLGRIAALTQALRPYRYLSVETPESLKCPSLARRKPLDMAYAGLINEHAKQGQYGRTQTLALQTANHIVATAYNSEAHKNIASTAEMALTTATRLAESAYGTGLKSQLTCAPSSPERGQLLASLYAAGVDITAVERAGGNFTYADFSGAQLAGIELIGLDLSRAKLQNADFSNSLLRGVGFNGADLSNSNFTDANIQNSDFEGALLKGIKAESDTFHFLPELSNKNVFSGAILYFNQSESDVKRKICTAFRGMGKNIQKKTHDIARAHGVSNGETHNVLVEVEEYGIITEIRKGFPDQSPQVAAVIVPSFGLPRVTLYESKNEDKGGVKVEYIPIDRVEMSGCNR